MKHALILLDGLAAPLRCDCRRLYASRAQLKSSYSKLGVHDKAELTGYFVLNS